MSKFLDKIIERAKTDKQKIVLPEGSDIRTVQAARAILDAGIADVIILGSQSEVAAHGIGAQREVPVLSRPQQRIGVHRQRVAGIEHRRKHGEGGDGQQKQQPGNRCRVA